MLSTGALPKASPRRPMLATSAESRSVRPSASELYCEPRSEWWTSPGFGLRRVTATASASGAHRRAPRRPFEPGRLLGRLPRRSARRRRQLLCEGVLVAPRERICVLLQRGDDATSVFGIAAEMLLNEINPHVGVSFGSTSSRRGS
jgi:hypothetical protein